MPEPDLRKIVEEVVRVLAEKGYIKGSTAVTPAKAGVQSIKGVDSGLRRNDGIARPSSALPKTTVGTAGKVFSESWNRPYVSFPAVSPPPVLDIDGDDEHTGSGACPHCAPLCGASEKDLKALGLDRVGVCHPTKQSSPVARYVDHTLLKPNATQEEIASLCEEAKAYCFASVCVNPSYVPLCAQLLKGSGVKVCTVVGFPLGSTTSTVKAIEARDAIANGADEIDMVINVGALKSGNDAAVYDDIRAVREATRGRVLKVILETALLTDDEKARACLLAKKAGADFVKTSTGFGGGGATVEDVELMRRTVGPMMGVKASGGIRDAKAAEAMIKAGATRLGTSASVAIVTNASGGGKGY